MQTKTIGISKLGVRGEGAYQKGTCIKKGNQRQRALAIGWVINTLTGKMKEYGISAEDYS